MTNDELVERVARAIAETPPEEKMIYDEGGALVQIQRDLRPTARAAISTIYEALQEPTEEMRIAGTDTMRMENRASEVWRAMLTASPLNGGK